MIKISINEGKKFGDTVTYLYLGWTEFIYKKVNNRHISTFTGNYWFPISRLIYEMIWRIDFFINRILGKNPKLCGGCGEGIQRWKIVNPNYQKTDYWYCCNRCVDFYDYKMTKTRLV